MASLLITLSNHICSSCNCAEISPAFRNKPLDCVLVDSIDAVGATADRSRHSKTNETQAHWLTRRPVPTGIVLKGAGSLQGQHLGMAAWQRRLGDRQGGSAEARGESHHRCIHLQSEHVVGDQS